jgi:hypothetical protein
MNNLKALCMESKQNQPLPFEDDGAFTIGGAKGLGRGILLHCVEMLFHEKRILENSLQHVRGLLQIQPRLRYDIFSISEIMDDGSYRSGVGLFGVTFQRQCVPVQRCRRRSHNDTMYSS